MGNSCSNQGQQKPAGWLKWKEPGCGSICRGEDNCCFTDHGRFPDTYPPFLAGRGIDEQAFKADIAAVNEHVRAATRVLFRMKDWRILILLILVLTAVAGSLHAKLEGIQNGHHRRWYKHARAEKLVAWGRANHRRHPGSFD